MICKFLFETPSEVTIIKCVGEGDRCVLEYFDEKLCKLGPR